MFILVIGQFTQAREADLINEKHPDLRK